MNRAALNRMMARLDDRMLQRERQAILDELPAIAEQTRVKLEDYLRTGELPEPEPEREDCLLLVPEATSVREEWQAKLNAMRERLERWGIINER